MRRSIKRRDILAVISAGAVSVAGCVATSEGNSEGSQEPASPEDCSSASFRLTAEPPEELVSTRDRLEEATGKEAGNITAEDVERATGVSPIVPTELSDEQESILKQAIDDGLYFECSQASDALRSFEELIEGNEALPNLIAFAESNGQLYKLTYCSADECTG